MQLRIKNTYRTETKSPKNKLIFSEGDIFFMYASIMSNPNCIPLMLNSVCVALIINYWCRLIGQFIGVQFHLCCPNQIYITDIDHTPCITGIEHVILASIVQLEHRISFMQPHNYTSLWSVVSFVILLEKDQHILPSSRMNIDFFIESAA